MVLFGRASKHAAENFERTPPVSVGVDQSILLLVGYSAIPRARAAWLKAPGENAEP
ncbi:MAG: hypothetical protein ACI9W2_002730 [Gammaproteobacteria bacterium]|jgi:hypothetical protein